MCIVRTNINIQKYHFEIFNSLHLENARSCLCAILHKSTVTYGSSVDQLFNEQLVELPAILDSLFHKVVNTTSKSGGVAGWGEVGSHEVAGPSDQKNFYDHVASIQAVFSPKYHKTQLNHCPVSPASRVVIPCQLSACPGKMEPFIDHPGTLGRQTG